MRIGIFGGETSNGPFDRIVDAARRTADEGFATFWLPQIFGVDALGALAVIGREVPRIELGTAVVPTYPRHPVVLAQQGLTTQAASGGRLALGIGLSHQIVIEGMFGYSFEKPARHMREYLEVLVPLVRDGAVSFKGETLTANAGLDVKEATPFPILLAALGPRMLELAGQVGDGTITWMTGPETVASYVVPTINAAAEAAGRPTPRTIVGLPVSVTSDAAAAKERASTQYEMYGTLPSYRAMLDREGVAGPADVAIVGDEDAVRGQLERVRDGGASDFIAAVFGASEERDRTRELLRSML
jgi:F420-dependent oxidoreductase-like protein